MSNTRSEAQTMVLAVAISVAAAELQRRYTMFAEKPSPARKHLVERGLDVYLKANNLTDEQLNTLYITTLAELMTTLLSFVDKEVKDNEERASRGEVKGATGD